MLTCKKFPLLTPNMQKKIILSYFGFELKKFLEIAPLFYMYIDMGGGIAGKQDRPSLGIEGPPQGPSNSQTL